MFPVIARDFSTFFADFSLENRGLFLTFLCRMTEPGYGAEKEMFSCSIKGLVTENISFSVVEFVNRKRLQNCEPPAAFSARFPHLLSAVRENSPSSQTLRSAAEISANLAAKASPSSPGPAISRLTQKAQHIRTQRNR